MTTRWHDTRHVTSIGGFKHHIFNSKNSKNIVRKDKGTSVGGQFAVDPNGPASKSRQDVILGAHPENVIAADAKRKKKEAMDRFLAKQEKDREETHAVGLPGKQTLKRQEKRKKEAMDRFLAKQKKEREEAHAVGLPGKVTMKRVLKIEADPAINGIGQHVVKLRKLEWIAHAQGKPGFNTLRMKWPNADILKMIPGQVAGNTLIRSGDITPAGKEKDSAQLRADKHQRHMDERAKKEKSLFRQGKNIAAKRHNMKVAGRDWNTPAGPVEGAKDTSGKFIAVIKRGVHGNRLHDKHGNQKMTWKLLATENRGGQPDSQLTAGIHRQIAQAPKPVRQIAQAPKPVRHDGRKDPAWPAGIAPVPRKDGIGEPYSGGHKDMNNGKVLYTLPPNEQGHKGAFVSQINDIAGDGRGILKSNGWDRVAGKLGFAAREIGAYKIDELLGLGVVPFTEEFDDHENQLHYEHGDIHSLQHFVKAKMGVDVGPIDEQLRGIKDKTEISKMALIDILQKNDDRHDQNYMIGEGHLYAIDNGLTMRQSETDAVDGMRGWGCDLKRHAQSEPPAEGHYMNRMKLSSVYKTKLDTAIKDGSLDKVLDWVSSRSVGPDMKADALKYVKIRAQSVVDNWDQLFVD